MTTKDGSWQPKIWRVPELDNLELLHAADVTYDYPSHMHEECSVVLILQGTETTVYEKYEWQKIHPLLDFINVMTYSLAPPGKTRPNSPLYQSSTETGRWSATFNTDYAVTRYLKEGVPAKKIVMGVPFYGLGWAGVPDVNNGLFQKLAKTESGSWRGISE